VGDAEAHRAVGPRLCRAQGRDEARLARQQIVQRRNRESGRHAPVRGLHARHGQRARAPLGQALESRGSPARAHRVGRLDPRFRRPRRPLRARRAAICLARHPPRQRLLRGEDLDEDDAREGGRRVIPGGRAPQARALEGGLGTPVDRHEDVAPDDHVERVGDDGAGHGFTTRHRHA